MDRGRRRVLHVLDGRYASGYFPDLAQFADAERYELLFTSVKRLPEEQAARLERPGVSSYAPLAGQLTDDATALTPRALLAAVRSLRQVIHRTGPSLVHVHLFEPALIAAIATLPLGPPLVVDRHHGDLLHRSGSRRHVAVDRFTTRRAEAVIVHSQFVRRVLVEKENAPPAKVAVIAYGLDTSAVQPATAEAVARFRGELSRDATALIVLIPARLDPEKGHVHLLDALATVRRAGVPCLALLAGQGPHAAALEAAVADRGLTDCVTFLGFRSDMPLLYQAADVTVLPTLSEAFGQVLIESQVYGTPVIASDVGGVSEVVVDGQSGLLVPPADPAALAAAILRVAADPALRRRMGQAAVDLVRAGFDSRLTARQTEDLYDVVLERADRRQVHST